MIALSNFRGLIISSYSKSIAFDDDSVYLNKCERKTNRTEADATRKNKAAYPKATHTYIRYKTMRLSIKPHNREFLTNLATQAGCSETEILNHLLLEMRLDSLFGADKASLESRAIAFGGASAIANSVQAVVSRPVPAFSKIEVPDYLPASVMQEIDPIIARMAELIENF